MKDNKFGRVTANSSKIASEYDQEIPQSQTTDNPMAPLNHYETPGILVGSL